VADEQGVRADRRRNRVRIIDAARSVILARGRAAGMDEIAAAAGLAVGTLYRHFPTKDELVDAILMELAEETSALVGSFEEALASKRESPIVLLEALLRTVVVELSTTRMLRDALGGSEPQLRGMQERANALLAQLVQAAHQDETLRDEVLVEDIILLLRAAPDERLSAQERERWLQTVLHGVLATRP